MDCLPCVYNGEPKANKNLMSVCFVSDYYSLGLIAQIVLISGHDSDYNEAVISQHCLIPVWRQTNKKSLET